MEAGNYIHFTDVVCSLCSFDVNSRPFLVWLVPSAVSLVIGLVYAQLAFPLFTLNAASWRQSDKLTFNDIVASKSGTFRVRNGPSYSDAKTNKSALLDNLEPS